MKMFSFSRLAFVFLHLVSLCSSEEHGAPAALVVRSGVAVLAEDNGVNVTRGSSLRRAAGTTLEVPRVLKTKEKVPKAANSNKEKVPKAANSNKKEKVPKAANSKKAKSAGVTTPQPSSQSSSQATEVCATIITQKDALLALKEGLINNDASKLADWDSNTDPCNDAWTGIFCDCGDVTIIEMYDNSLTGSIPTEIGSLTSLTGVSFQKNSLTGSIPTEIGSLTSLIYIDFAQNSLSGSIPTEIGSLTSLTQLVLYWNSLSGSIPTEIGSLTSLTQLALDNNDLTGAMPAQICALVAGGLNLSYDIAEVTGCPP